MSRRFGMLAIACLVGSSIIMAQEAGSTEKTGANRIDAVATYGYCKTMCLPEYAGRLTGHPGYTAAARWAADLFKQWGLKSPQGIEGFLQPFPAPYTVVERSTMTLYLPGEKEPRETALELSKDFMPLLFSDSGDHTAGLVFAGWGISAPELGYDDYAGIDVAGKFILCFRGTPNPKDERFTDHDQHRTRMKVAADKGALGIIYIYEQPQANPNGDWIKGFTPAMISAKTADKILAEKGLTCADLRRDLERYRRPLSFALQTTAHLVVESHHTPDATGFNVAGVVEGADAQLKSECIIVGAHFDHCGAHLGKLFAGADDNASGSAVVMELARVFASLPFKPKRSVVFVLFGSEEKGLQGSGTFAQSLPYGFAKVTGMVNLDMVGEGDGVWMACSQSAPEVKDLVLAADADSKLIKGSSTITRVGVRSSDFAPFFLKGIPCVALGSNGPHVFYHEPGDSIYRINPDIMADIAHLVFRFTFRIADR